MAGNDLPPVLAESEARLSKVSGVVRAHTNLVCCDDGRAIVYVGIEERGTPSIRFRAEPVGKSRLAADIVEAGDEFSKAFMLTIRRGDTGEDRSQGHSISVDPAVRAIQERFVVYAKRDLLQLRRVLQDSSDAGQRALSAQILGYAPDKQGVVDDLVRAMADPSEEVRNNAMRALLVFSESVPTAAGGVPRIPPDPFIRFLKSPVWTDRNKASGALLTLSASRDASLLARLRKEALTELVEMARWRSDGHVKAAFVILGRIAGYSEDAIERAWDRRERDLVISAVLR